MRAHASYKCKLSQGSESLEKLTPSFCNSIKYLNLLNVAQCMGMWGC